MEWQSILFLYLVVIISAVVHEYAHAWAAFRQGDLTAKYAGRLTLNPLAHIDYWGTVILPLILLFVFHFFFGYAKPVPINPYNFRNQRRGMIWVSVAGVAANFSIAVLLALVARFLPGFFLNPFLVLIIQVNLWLGLFNLLPFPPLDGSKLLMVLIDTKNQRLRELADFLNKPLGFILAIFIAMTFLPYLADWLLKILLF